MRNTGQEFDVIIVGAGMVGAALAAALAPAGLRVAVVEQGGLPQYETGQTYDRRVSAINVGSENILRAVGAWDEIAAQRVSPYRRMFVWDEGSPGWIEFDSAELGLPHLGHIVENSLIASALHLALKGSTNISCFVSAQPKQLDPGPGHSTLSLQDGFKLTATLVVGADGAHSWVRQALHLDSERSDYGQQGIVAQVHTEVDHDHTAWQRFLATGPLAFLPLNNGDCSIVWSCNQSRTEELLGLPGSEFEHTLTRAFAGKLGAVRLVDTPAVFTLTRSVVQRYCCDRGVLIGDAAHTIHPLAGQGVNLGFADAAMLAQVILDAAAAGQDMGSMPVLRRYERARKGENQLMLGAMDVFLRLFGTDLAPVPQLRGLGLRLTNRIGPVKRLLAQRALGVAGDLPRLAQPHYTVDS